MSAQTIGVGPSIQTYTFDDPQAAGLETFRLITVPWAASVPVGGGVTVTAGGAWASGRATGEGGQEATLSGLTDTDVNVELQLGDWLVVGADASIGTGKSSLSLEESLVAGVIAADLLPFSVGTWGSGGRLGGSVAVAGQAGSWGLGLAGSYRVSSEFEPLPGQPLTYNPGDEVQLRAALDRNVGASSTFSLVLGWQSFSDDQALGANLFRSGNRIQGLASLAFPLGLRSSALVYGGVNHRSRGTLLLDESVLSGAGDSPSQQLFLAGTNLRVPLGRRAALLPAVETRVFRAEDGASQGWLTSGGASLDFRVVGNSSGRRLVLSPSGALRLGKVIVEQGAETGLFGWEAGLVVRLKTGR
jgi:hypothetical protein